MSSGYVRQSAANISTGLIINASDFNAEYNQIQAAFDGTSGHDHTGGIGLGQKIGLTNAVTGILPSANGGTGIAFFGVAGPTSLHTYTFPDADATILTSASTLGVANGGTGLTSGTSGGLLYFSATNVIASSAALAANQILLGAGAGNAPTSLSAGTGTTVLHGNASGAPTWGAVNVATDITGTVPITNGGTGQTTANAAFNALAPSQATNGGKYLTTDGTNTSWGTIAAGFADPGSNGIVIRTALNTTTARSITGTTNQITITNADGTAGNPNVAISTGYIGQTSITTLGTITTGTWSGTTIAVNKGGTGATTANAAFNALSPMTTSGDIIYGGASGAGIRLGANATGTNKYLQSVSSGNPSWAQVSDADLSVTDITTNNVSISAHGFVPKAPNDNTKFLRGDATWAVITTTPVYSQSSPADPTGTNSASAKMMGLAGSITPTGSGVVFFNITGTAGENGPVGTIGIQGYYGTGSAPANGASATGTSFGSLLHFNPASQGSDYFPFTCSAVISGLTPNTTYWIDIGLSNGNANTSSLKDISISAFELR